MALLEKVDVAWLNRQPVYLQFAHHHGGHHKTRREDFVAMLCVTGQIALVDDRKRPFVDVSSALWLRSTVKAVKAGFTPPLTCDDDHTVVKSQTPKRAASKAKQMRRARANGKLTA